jgi:hypothetical protein
MFKVTRDDLKNLALGAVLIGLIILAGIGLSFPTPDKADPRLTQILEQLRQMQETQQE